MRKYIDKSRITQEIIKAALKYRDEMVDRLFLYVFEGGAIEVVYRRQDFKHLTGVDSYESANQFYRDATRSFFL